MNPIACPVCQSRAEWIEEMMLPVTHEDVTVLSAGDRFDCLNFHTVFVFQNDELIEKDDL